MQFFSSRSRVSFQVLLFGVGLLAVARCLRAEINYATPYTFTTLAGAQSAGTNDGTGRAAKFNFPSGVVVDNGGNAYVVDSFNNTIRKVSSSGVVSTFAGLAGVPGSSDGVGTAARFNFPVGIAADITGTLYVADGNNHTIRKITPTGEVSTVAGAPGVVGTIDGLAGAARFNTPRGVAVDALGNIFVADSLNETIRKISPTGQVTTIAGSPGQEGFLDGTGTAARFSTPFGLAVDGSGIVYVLDTGNSAIRKIAANGQVSTAVGNADSALTVVTPWAMAVSATGDFYVADTLHSTVTKISPSAVVTVLAGSTWIAGDADGFGSEARFSQPRGIALAPNGDLYVTDSGNNAVKKVSPAGLVSTVAGFGSNSGSADGLGAAARFSAPQGLAVDLDGNLFVADQQNHTIRKITPQGNVTTYAGTAGVIGSPSGPVGFAYPAGVAVGQGGEIFVLEGGNGAVRKVTPDGVISLVAGGTYGPSPFNSPTGIAVGPSGNIYVADTWNRVIRKVTPGGFVTTLSGQIGSNGLEDGPAGTARFSWPTHVAVDAAENVYVSDFNRVRRVSATGVVTTIAGGVTGVSDGTGLTAQFQSLAGLCVDAAGNIFVADGGAIRKISPSGVVSSAAGIVNQGGVSDGLGASARFSYPYGVAVDGAGILYVSDMFGNTVRRGYFSDSPVMTLEPASQTVAEGYGVKLISSAVGSGTVTYQWKKNGVQIPGAVSEALALSLVTTDDAGSYTVTVSNSFGATTSMAAVLTVVSAPNRLNAVTGDFDRDEQSDLVWQNTVTGERSFWLMNGSVLKQGVSLGTFAPDWTVVGSGDFNADRKSDLLWQNTITGERSIWIMNGTSLVQGVDLGTYSTDIMIVASGDFNADGKTDIVWQNIATGERGVWLMNATTKTGDASLGMEAIAWSIAGTGDFNGDGKVDLLWQNAGTGERTIWLMNGVTKISSVSLGIVAKQFQIVGTGDYNGDGKTDLVWTDTETGERSLWLMNGTVRTSTVVFTLVSVEWSLARPIFLSAETAHADFNADGQTDLIEQNTTTGERKISSMNGRTVTSSVALGTLSTDWVIEGTGDLNHDDKPDLVWSNTVTGERAVWMMDGATKLSAVSLPTIPPNWVISAIGDFNYDGKPDIVWSDTTTGDRAVWLMNGTVFGSGISLGNIPPNWLIGTTADFNGDGKTDLVWQNTTTGECSVWLMNGTSFAAGVALASLASPLAIVGTGDFNADGNADLLIQNNVTGERSVRLLRRTLYSGDLPLSAAAVHLSITN